MKKSDRAKAACIAIIILTPAALIALVNAGNLVFSVLLTAFSVSVAYILTQED
jgi:hypothetical protein